MKDVTVHQFLTDMQRAGKHNMLEGPKMIEQAFGLTPEEAKSEFWHWTQTLDRSDGTEDS